MDRPRTGQSLDRRRNSLTSDNGFGLNGPSNLPDPAFHAYRRDLADVALAGRVIASHFVEPVECTLLRSAAFRAEPKEEAEVITDLMVGERIRMLDCKFGWAWGYAGADDRVGYVKADALGLE